MNTAQSTMSAPKKFNRHNDDLHPVFKVNYKGQILYANHAAMKLLYEIGVSGNGKISKKLIDDHPEIFKMHSSTTILLAASNIQYDFDVVSFDEAGYIGFYANQIKHFNN